MNTNKHFATASIILGIIALVTFPFIIPPFICGPLAIIFAMISKSKEYHLSVKAWLGTISGALGILACTILTTIALYTTIQTIGLGTIMHFYADLMEYAVTLDEDELIDFMDDVGRGDFSDFTDSYELPEQFNDTIWY